MIGKVLPDGMTELSDLTPQDWQVIDHMSAVSNLPDFPRRFLLERNTDISGVSGTGVVVWGVVFPDGRVAYRWNTPTATTCTADSIEDVVAIHGHEGATQLVWIDVPFFAKGAQL